MVQCNLRDWKSTLERTKSDNISHSIFSIVFWVPEYIIITTWSLNKLVKWDIKNVYYHL